MMAGGWPYRYLAGAIDEREALVPKERAALINAETKLAVGPNLPFPHSTVVQGADRLRELRPRSGRSPWRDLYRRVGGEFVIAAVGPEAQVDQRGFATACRRGRGTTSGDGERAAMSKLSESRTGDQLRAEDLKDPEVPAELARTAWRTNSPSWSSSTGWSTA